MTIEDVRAEMELPPQGDGGATDNIIDAAIGQAIKEAGPEGMSAVLAALGDAVDKMGDGC